MSSVVIGVASTARATPGFLVVAIGLHLTDRPVLVVPAEEA